jgi:hypothetical protein
MKGSSGNLYLIGDTLLQHLYQVYDFEHETIALGINTHSEGKVLMFDAGKRPEDRPKVQTSQDAMSMEESNMRTFPSEWVLIPKAMVSCSKS